LYKGKLESFKVAMHTKFTFSWASN